jgi:hypothetical protein
VPEKRLEKSSESLPEPAPRVPVPLDEEVERRGARNSDAHPDLTPDASLSRQNQGRWKLSFSLFLLGFMLLIVAARRSLPVGETWALGGVATVLCVGAFLLARQAHRKPHA